MELTIGTVYEGKVTGITKFGAFVQLPTGKSGMVHISEIANTYVDDITKHLADGQAVSVKLIGIDEVGRINLSIKKALPEQQRQEPRPVQSTRSTLQKTEDNTFEDKLRTFMQSSESKMFDIKSNTDKKTGARRRK